MVADRCWTAEIRKKQPGNGFDDQDYMYFSPKGKRGGIMVSASSVFSLQKHRQGELENAGVQLEAVVLFEYGKEDRL